MNTEVAAVEVTPHLQPAVHRQGREALPLNHLLNNQQLGSILPTLRLKVRDSLWAIAPPETFVPVWAVGTHPHRCRWGRGCSVEEGGGREWVAAGDE